MCRFHAVLEVEQKQITTQYIQPVPFRYKNKIKPKATSTVNLKYKIFIMCRYSEKGLERCATKLSVGISGDLSGFEQRVKCLTVYFLLELMQECLYLL